MFARVYDDPAGGRWLAEPHDPYTESFRPRNVRHLLALALQGFRVPVETFAEAKAHLRRVRSISPQAAGGSPCRTWRDTLRGRTGE